MQNKVLFIGLDAAAFSYINLWLELLPNINGIIKSGVFLELVSVIPPLTPPAWTSMMTGKNPGKHRVFHFFETDGKNFVDSRSIKAETVWEILSINGKKVIVINMPLTYPVKKVNGCLISGFLTPDEKHNFVYPKKLRNKLLEMNYKILSDLVLKGKEKYRIAELKESVKTRLKTALWLLKNYPWDFAAVVFMETDQVQHFYFKNRQRVLELYSEIDKAIGTLISNVPEETCIIVASDHGFGERKCSVSLNAYFYQLGILRIKSTRFVIKRVLNKFLSIMFNHLDVFRKPLIILLQKISKCIPLKKVRETVRSLPIYLRDKSYMEFLIHEFDLSRTIAYSPFPWFDHVNYGLVKLLSSSKKVRKWIIKKIYEISNPKTGEKLVENIYYKGDVYWGKYAHLGPDLIIEFKEGCSGNYSFFSNGSCFKEFDDGMHYRKGIAIFKGPAIKEGIKLNSHVMIWDICPTILHILNQPIPNDVDGRVLTEIFKPESKISKIKPKYVKRGFFETKKLKEEIKLKIGKLKKTGKI